MRKGFFLGDGAGVGKGRTIAACIKEHFAAGHGTRALWVSVSKEQRSQLHIRNVQLLSP